MNNLRTPGSTNSFIHLDIFDLLYISLTYQFDSVLRYSVLILYYQVIHYQIDAYDLIDSEVSKSKMYPTANSVIQQTVRCRL